MHIGNMTCKQKTLNVGKSISLAQANGHYIPGCSAFVNTALFWRHCGLISQKEMSFHHCTVRVSRVIRVRVSVRIEVRFRFINRVDIRLPDA